MHWQNPYINGGVWLKGNLHTHSTVSDGRHKINEVVRLYKELAKYDFLVMTDHTGNKTKIEEFTENIQLDDFVLIMGREESGGHHILGIDVPMTFYDDPIKKESDSYSIADYQFLINRIKDEGGLAIIPHPHWKYDDYWTAEQILKLDGITAFEVINGDRFNGPRNLATDVWDEVLTAGKVLWAVGSDDFHHPRDYYNAWTMVKAKSNTKTDIMEAIECGSCYTSNGASFESIETDGDYIIIKCSNESIYSKCEKTFRFIGEGGKLLQLQMGKSPTAVYRGQGNEKYVRVEMTLDWGMAAFTQPFFSVV